MNISLHHFCAPFIVSGCGIVTEQECDECFEDARFHEACDNYFAEKYAISFDCYSGVDLQPDCFCNSDDENNDACFVDGDFQLGAYEFGNPDCEVELDPEDYRCESFADNYDSCTNWKNTRKEALSRDEEKRYYSSEECRRWAWDDNDWSIEKAIESRDCEEFAELIGLEQMFE